MINDIELVDKEAFSRRPLAGVKCHFHGQAFSSPAICRGQAFSGNIAAHSAPPIE